LAVKDGQSILMGGLISNVDTDNNSGVPLLKDIPGLGWMFKNKTKKETKQELLLMVTPYVIENEDVLDQYIKGFKEKVDGLRQDLAK
jgi:general secretion pathway protein D